MTDTVTIFCKNNKKARDFAGFRIFVSDYFALSALNLIHFSSASSSAVMAPCGHSEMQTPHSMQVSGLTTHCVSASVIAPTGQTSMQVKHFTHESLITEAISILLEIWLTAETNIATFGAFSRTFVQKTPAHSAYRIFEIL